MFERRLGSAQPTLVRSAANDNFPPNRALCGSKANFRSGSAEIDTWETAVLPHIADMIRCPDRALNRGSADFGFWECVDSVNRRNKEKCMARLWDASEIGHQGRKSLI